jgi:hypothetical protein
MQDLIAQRIDTLTDIIFGLHVGAHMRRRFTDDERERLQIASDNLAQMLWTEREAALHDG